MPNRLRRNCGGSCSKPTEAEAVRLHPSRGRCTSESKHFLLFEKLINVIHEHAPQAKICFNTLPSDTADAVKRWLSVCIFVSTLKSGRRMALERTRAPDAANPPLQASAACG